MLRRVTLTKLYRRAVGNNAQHTMKIKILFIILALITGCGTTSTKPTNSSVIENNKDVFILSLVIQNQLRKTHEIGLDLDELIRLDSLNRISNIFETLEIKFHGGYIAAYYKFSNTRNSAQIELNKTELEEIDNLKWIVKNFKEQFDGEIQFEYGERGYGIRKIITRQ